MELGHARLWRELEEIEREPLQGIRIHIHDNSNLRRMCLILSPVTGPFVGFRFHLDVTIPAEYPDLAPMVTMQSQIRHPNINGSSVRCDGLGTDYTPSYMLKYLFLQLLCLVSSDTIAQKNGRDPINLEAFVAKDYGWITCQFFCEICGFYAQDRMVNADVAAESGGANASPASVVEEFWVGDDSSKSFFDALDENSLRELLQRVYDEDIVHLAQAYKSMNQFVESNNIKFERSLFCTYTRKKMVEGALLGIGVDCQEKIVTNFDLTSSEAHFHGKQTDSFFPLALSEIHFKRGKDHLQDVLKFLSGRCDYWGPETVLDSIPVLMDSMADAIISERVPACEKSLEVFFLLYHLFWKLTQEDPALKQAMTSRINLFMKDVKTRASGSTPNPRVLLMYTLVMVDPHIESNRLGGEILREILTRKAVFYLQKYPELAYIEPQEFASELRLQQTFEVCSDTLKTLAFEASLIHLVKTVDPGELDKRYGFPEEETTEKLLDIAKLTTAMKTWDDFVAQLSIPGTQAVLNLLRSTMKMSERIGYHQVPYSQEELYWLRIQKEPSCPARQDLVKSRKRSRPRVHYNFHPKPQKQVK